jgi:hypothetical protein
MSKPIRAALYARVSTSGHGQDVGLQLDELHPVAAQRSWVPSEFVDEGVSRSKLHSRVPKFEWNDVESEDVCCIGRMSARGRRDRQG